MQGIDDIQAQFRILTMFKSLEHDIASVLLTTIPTPERTGLRDLVIIDSTLTFGLYVGSFKIRSITRFEFDTDGKICNHEDIWSLRHFALYLPIFGKIYEFGRYFIGYTSSRILQALVGTYDETKSH